jgi:hypothetical protein
VNSLPPLKDGERRTEGRKWRFREGLRKELERKIEGGGERGREKEKVREFCGEGEKRERVLERYFVDFYLFWRFFTFRGFI